MAHSNMLEDGSSLVEDEEPLIAATRVGLRLCLGVTAKVPHSNTVRMVFQCRVVTPELPTRMIPEGVTDKDFLAAIPVNIERIRKMPRLSLAFPKQFETVVENPEVPVAVFDQDLLATFVSRQIEESQ